MPITDYSSLTIDPEVAKRFATAQKNVLGVMPDIPTGPSSPDPANPGFMGPKQPIRTLENGVLFDPNNRQFTNVNNGFDALNAKPTLSQGSVDATLASSSLFKGMTAANGDTLDPVSFALANRASASAQPTVASKLDSAIQNSLSKGIGVNALNHLIGMKAALQNADAQTTNANTQAGLLGVKLKAASTPSLKDMAAYMTAVTGQQRLGLDEKKFGLDQDKAKTDALFKQGILNNGADKTNSAITTAYLTANPNQDQTEAVKNIAQMQALFGSMDPSSRASILQALQPPAPAAVSAKADAKRLLTP